MNVALGYDDITLIPQYSEVMSREDGDLSVSLGNFKTRIPLISANMDTITGSLMAISMWKLGGVGALHRFMSIEDNVKEYEFIRSQEADCWVTVGATSDGLERAKQLVSSGARNLIVDIAHGHSMLMKRALQELKGHFGESVSLMAGNVATPEAIRDLVEWGADLIKVGVGSGSICKTRIVTGHGVPMFSCLLECCAAAKVPVVADGGIRNAGDIIKAFVAGTSAVMVGSLLAGTTETPGDLLRVDGHYVKEYRGMASREARVRFSQWMQSSGESHPAVEGVATMVDHKGNVRDIVREIIGGIRSGMSYCNARTLNEIHLTGKWRLQSMAGYIEGTPHILR